MYSLCLLAFVRDLDRYSYIASAAVLPSALAALLAACALPSGALSPRVGPRSAPRGRRLLAAALCALLSLLCCAAAPALQCFRSDVRHYSRALGRRDKRAFPHYLLGLSHQRAAEKANGQASVVESAHRSAVKALTLAEALAPGWLNLAAARAESFAALNDHESAGASSCEEDAPLLFLSAPSRLMPSARPRLSVRLSPVRNLQSIARARPGAKHGFYDYALAVRFRSPLRFDRALCLQRPRPIRTCRSS
jgi:hypothetical protein